MPLKPGSSQKTISRNISELESSQSAAGKQRSHKQNIAIAYAEARRTAGKSKVPSPPQPKSKHGDVADVTIHPPYTSISANKSGMPNAGSPASGLEPNANRGAGRLPDPPMCNYGSSDKSVDTTLLRLSHGNSPLTRALGNNMESHGNVMRERMHLEIGSRAASSGPSGSVNQGQRRGPDPSTVG